MWMLHSANKLIHFKREIIRFFPTKLTTRFKQDCFVDSCFISAGVIHPHGITGVFHEVENCAERHNFGARVVIVLSRIGA
jgi:hypothetical protein